MLLVSRPLTLLALAICAYITITWKLQAPRIPSVLSIYDENGFRRYDPLEAAVRPGTEELAKSETAGEDIGDQQQPLPPLLPANPLASNVAFTKVEQPSSTTIIPIPTAGSILHDEYMKDILDWERPKHKNGHWPPYEDFSHKDYDPNRWEGFKL
jgi:hypothetical protein